MHEIAARPWNGWQVASLFSGCGGSALGYKLAGFKVIWANEFIPAAQATYRLNHPDTILDTRDIRTIQPQEILTQIHMQAGELDILDGSPPCAAFSTAGKRNQGWGKVKAYSDTQQRTDDLFFEYARILKGVQPKVFVAENVSGLVKGVAKGYFKQILTALRACGYIVEARLLDAQWLGVPQMRQRIIFMGVRTDLGHAPAFPQPLPYRYSVRDALPWIVATGGIRDTGFGQGQMSPAYKPSQTIMAVGGHGMNTSQFGVEARVIHDTGGQYSCGDVTDQPAPTVDMNPRFFIESSSLRRTIEPESDMSQYTTGTEWEKLQPGEQSQRYFQLVKPSLALPCPTVTQLGGNAGIASVCHPTERRKFSIAELKRLCAFPDDFQLTGTYAQQWERLGRAVPPVMMQHIAKTIADRILACVG